MCCFFFSPEIRYTYYILNLESLANLVYFLVVAKRKKEATAKTQEHLPKLTMLVKKIKTNQKQYKIIDIISERHMKPHLRTLCKLDPTYDGKTLM